MPSTLDKLKRLDFRAEHLKLIRNLRISWTNCEAGAPVVDGERRFGSKNILDDMARILAYPNPNSLTDEEKAELAKLDEEIAEDISLIFLRQGKISPGVYSIHNTMIEDFPEAEFTINADGAGTYSISRDSQIKFTLKDEHIRLLRCLNWHWLCVDPKRPYGDMTYFYIDMAHGLGWPMRIRSDGTVAFSKDQIHLLNRLHAEMVFALKAYFQHANLDLGKFVRKGNEPWRRIRPEDAVENASRPDSGDSIAGTDDKTVEIHRPPKKATSESANARKRMFGNILDLFNAGVPSTHGDLTRAAIVSTTLLIEKQPQNPLLYATRASYRKQSKHYDEAIKDYTKAIELGKDKQLAYMWLEGRALIYDTLGRETEALNDLSEVIRIQPQYVPAHYYRGRIYNTRKMPDKALLDFDMVIDANPGWNADVYYSRGVANLSLENSLQAAKDFKHYLDSDRWTDRTAPYAVLFGYLAFRKAGKHLDAQALVATANDRLQGAAWPNIIVQYFLGNVSEEKVLSATSNVDDLTEAHWFIGAKYTYDSRPEDAMKHLRWVVEHGNKSFVDYELAKVELTRLLR